MTVTTAPQDPPKVCCRLVTCLIAGGVLLLEQLIIFGYAVNSNNGFLGTIAVLFFLLLVFTSISIFGSHATWNSLKKANLVIFIILSFIFVIFMSYQITTWETLKRLPTHNSTEISDRDKRIGDIFLYILIACFEFAVFVVLYLPLQCLYSEPKAEDTSVTT